MPTETTQASSIGSNQMETNPEPAPSPCRNASGHPRYATQWTARHNRLPTRSRSRLVMIIAMVRYTEMTPSPTHSGR